MKKLIDRRSIPFTLAGLTILLAILLYSLPPEQTLGNIIKVVFLHGALVETGLIAFGIAGLLGLVYLVSKRERVYQWCLATQKTALVVWVLYALSSIVATYLAWGVAIAWEEPRVLASAKILIVSLGFFLLVLWVNHRQFTAVANVVTAVAAWALTKGAITLRHPFNPIGSSDSAIFKWLFAIIVAVVLLMAFQLTRWLHVGREDG